jgi:hypothetical protein
VWRCFDQATTPVTIELIRLSRPHRIQRLVPKERRQIDVDLLRPHEGIAAAERSGDRPGDADACSSDFTRSGWATGDSAR